MQSAPRLSAQEGGRVGSFSAPIPFNEQLRLKILRQSGVLESSPNEEAFDRIVHICCRTFKVSHACISLVNLDHVWLKSKVGLSSPRIDRSQSICAATMLESTEDVFIVPDLTEDHRFVNFLATRVGARFYAGASITCDGVRLGALAILSLSPNFSFGPAEAEKLKGLAGVVSILIEQRRNTMLDHDDHATTLVVGSSYSLKRPLQIVCEEKEKLRAALFSNGAVRTEAVAAFQAKVQWLLQRVEMSIETALRYSHAMGVKIRAADRVTSVADEAFTVDRLRASLLQTLNVVKDNQTVNARFFGFDSADEIHAKLDTLYVVLGSAMASKRHHWAPIVHVDIHLVPSTVGGQLSPLPSSPAGERIDKEIGTLRISLSSAAHHAPTDGLECCNETLAEVILQAQSGWIEKPEDSFVCSTIIYLPCAFTAASPIPPLVKCPSLPSCSSSSADLFSEGTRGTSQSLDSYKLELQHVKQHAPTVRPRSPKSMGVVILHFLRDLLLFSRSKYSLVAVSGPEEGEY